jgi:monothiol glutaredoxin
MRWVMNSAEASQAPDPLRLPASKRSEHATRQIAAFHRDYLDEVKKLIEENDIVVVGMAQNPNVPRARKYLDDAGLKYAYIGHGSYLSGYRRRLAIKLWSGWPWFPMVFVKGILIGGANDVAAELKHGVMQKRLADPRP